MKRKTNLFYNYGPDSKFLTFSNYTESLTGNFLSTNTKLFPSTFICLYIPSLTYENKQDFINEILIKRYENKLAALRDNLSEVDILPLNYLLEYIYQYDSDTDIEFVGNITEQDYLGTYTDTICTIDTSFMEKGIFEFDDTEEYESIPVENKLYGWYDGENNSYTGPEIYKDFKPIFDINSSYIYTSNIRLKYFKSNSKSIQFNVVIPLFDFVDTDINSSSYIENNNNDEEKYLEMSYSKNVPLGIWFADRTITLENDEHYGQSWSLAIGSQFKPLPTSSKVRSDIYKTGAADAYNTFSQVLVKQNELLDKFEDFNKRLNDINKRLTVLEAKKNIK